MSGVRRGLSSRWPSASAEPRKPDWGAEKARHVGGHDAKIARSCRRVQPVQPVIEPSGSQLSGLLPVADESVSVTVASGPSS